MGVYENFTVLYNYTQTRYINICPDFINHNLQITDFYIFIAYN